MPPRRAVLGMSNGEETPGPTQDILKGLYLAVGLGMAQDPPGWAGGSNGGKTSLSFLAEAAATVTRTQTLDVLLPERADNLLVQSNTLLHHTLFQSWLMFCKRCFRSRKPQRSLTLVHREQGANARRETSLYFYLWSHFTKNTCFFLTWHALRDKHVHHTVVSLFYWEDPIKGFNSCVLQDNMLISVCRP